jgi:hypothetical protein
MSDSNMGTPTPSLLLGAVRKLGTFTSRYLKPSREISSVTTGKFSDSIQVGSKQYFAELMQKQVQWI